MTDIYVTSSLSTHNANGTPQNTQVTQLLAKYKEREVGEFLKLILKHKLKMDGMGDTCRNCGEEEKHLQDFGGETRKSQTTWET